MRIALVTSSYAPYVGGVEEHVRNVARVLKNRGHDVVVWTVDREGGHDQRTVDGIDVWDLPTPLPARSLRAMFAFAVHLPSAALRWHRAVRAHRPDIVHVQCFGPNGTYARVLTAMSKTPLIISTHGETIADDAAVFSSSRFAARSLERGLAQAAAVTGCSQVTIDDLVARFGLEDGRGVVVFNGIDATESGEGQTNIVNGRYIAAVGRLQHVKGFDLLIRAFARARLPQDVRLVIGGGGPELEPLRSLAAELGLEDRVVLPGWLDRPSVNNLLHGALVGVVPSRFESFGIAALEVWRAGAPLIATNHGGPPEFIRDGVDALLVTPETDQEFADALTRLVFDSTDAAALAAAGAARVHDFSWDSVADAYEAIYEGLKRQVA